MSKPVKKDKKNDGANSGLQLAFQNQKRELLDCQFSIKKLQQRVNVLASENLFLKSKLQQCNHIYNQSLEEITLKNMANQKRLFALSNEKTKLQIENQQKQNKIKVIEKNLFDEQQIRMKDFQENKKNYNFQIAKYQSQLSQYKLYMSQRDQLQQQRQDLREKVEIEKANKLRDIADKEKQKVQATDKLKDEMLHKINEMRKNLFSLKREQLSTTTRLTMLQNHQLTSELEYQSKQTQKMIFKSQQNEQKIISLKQQLDIHKEVEEELAKRSHFSKGIIKKLNLKINQLENQIDKLKNQLCLPRKSSIIHSDQLSQQTNTKSKSISSQKKHVQHIQQSLEKTQKAYIQLQTLYEVTLKKKQQQQTKLESFEKKANELFKILHKYYTYILAPEKFEQIDKTEYSKDQRYEQTVQFTNQNLPYNYELKKLRSTPVEKWNADDLTLTMQILLNAVQPYLLRSNLFIPAVRKNIIVNDSINRQQNSQTISNKALPKLLTERKQTLQTKIQQSIPTSLASKIVCGNLREWGQTLRLNKASLTRKYKLSQSYRG